MWSTTVDDSKMVKYYSTRTTKLDVPICLDCPVFSYHFRTSGPAVDYLSLGGVRHDLTHACINYDTGADLVFKSGSSIIHSIPKVLFSVPEPVGLLVVRA